jgi:hypothetical protein
MSYTDVLAVTTRGASGMRLGASDFILIVLEPCFGFGLNEMTLIHRVMRMVRA